MILYFPNLHPDLLTEVQRKALPEGALFLDPGLARPDSPMHVLPDAAPFDRRLAKAVLADTLRFGESVSSPRDLAVHGLLQRAEALNVESSRLVEAEVARSLAGAPGQAASEGDPLLEARRQAQTLLLLAWSLEERMLELRGIDQGLRESWERLGRSVSDTDNPGGEAAPYDDEMDGEAVALGRVLSGLTLPEPLADGLPWRRMLEAFSVLAPGASLVTVDQAIGAALREAGLAESDGAFAAPAWKLAGLDRCPADRPWLDASLRLAVARDA